MSDADPGRRPTVEEVDPEALAANALDDQTRMHGEGDETELVQGAGGHVLPVDESGTPVPPDDSEREVPLDDDERESERDD